MVTDSYLAFCAASLALAVVPGPTVTVIIANSLRHGTRAGMMNVLGTQAGVAIWLVIAVLGLNAMIAVMGVWFDALRYVGAAYLIWLGIKLLRSNGDLAVAVDRARPRGSFFLQGLRGDPVQPQDAGAVRRPHPALSDRMAAMRQQEHAGPWSDLRGDRGRQRYGLCAGGRAGGRLAFTLSHPADRSGERLFPDRRWRLDGAQGARLMVDVQVWQAF